MLKSDLLEQRYDMDLTAAHEAAPDALKPLFVTGKAAGGKKVAVPLGTPEHPFALATRHKGADGVELRYRAVRNKEEVVLFTRNDDPEAALADYERNRAVPSLHELEAKILHMMRPGSTQLCLGVVSGPGLGKTTLFENICNIASKEQGNGKAYMKFDCTGKSMGEVLFRPVKDDSSIGVNMSRGPLLHAMLEGDGTPLLLDELLRGREHDYLLDVIQFLNRKNAKPDDVLILYPPFGEKIEISRKDIKPGFRLFMATNYNTEDPLSSAMASRLEMEQLGGYERDDWQSRITRILTGVPITANYYMMQNTWDKNPREFAKFLKTKLTDRNPKQPAPHELKLIDNWQHVVEFSAQLGDLLYDVANVLRQDDASLKEIQDPELRREIRNLANNVQIDPRFVEQKLYGTLMKKFVPNQSASGSVKTGSVKRGTIDLPDEKEIHPEMWGTKMSRALEEMVLSIAGRGTPHLYRYLCDRVAAAGFDAEHNNATAELLDNLIGGRVNAPAPAPAAKPTAPSNAPKKKGGFIGQLPSTAPQGSAPSSPQSTSRAQPSAPAHMPTPSHRGAVTQNDVLYMLEQLRGQRRRSFNASDIQTLLMDPAQATEGAKAQILVPMRKNRAIYTVNSYEYGTGDNPLAMASARDELAADNASGRVLQEPRTVDLLVSLAMPLTSAQTKESIFSFKPNKNAPGFLAMPKSKDMLSGRFKVNGQRFAITACSLHSEEVDKYGSNKKTALICVNQGDKVIVAAHESLMKNLDHGAASVLTNLLAKQNIQYFNLGADSDRENFIREYEGMTSGLSAKEKMAANAALMTRADVRSYTYKGSTEHSREETVGVSPQSGNAEHYISDEHMLPKLLRAGKFLYPSLSEKALSFTYS